MIVKINLFPLYIVVSIVTLLGRIFINDYLSQIICLGLSTCCMIPIAIDVSDRLTSKSKDRCFLFDLISQAILLVYSCVYCLIISVICGFSTDCKIYVYLMLLNLILILISCVGKVFGTRKEVI